MSGAGRRSLNRRRILEAAVGLADREGLEALSMRRLGTELGVEAMSLYNHVSGKEALLDGMVEVLLEEMKLPSKVESWELLVREGYRAVRRLSRKHPNVFPLFVRRPPDTLGESRLLEAFLGTLRDAGFDKETSLHAFRTLSSYTIGYALAEIRGFALESGGDRPGFRDLTKDEFPRIFEITPLLETPDHDAEFEFGLDLILAGLREHKTRR